MTGKPKFEFIDVTTKKKMSRMNEISAVELALIPGTFLLLFPIIKLCYKRVNQERNFEIAKLPSIQMADTANNTYCK